MRPARGTRTAEHQSHQLDLLATNLTVVPQHEPSDTLRVSLHNNGDMGVLCDYFSASSDDVAAAVVDRVGGPGAPVGESATATRRRGWFSRKAMLPLVEPEMHPTSGFDTVSANGIDPVVMMGTLEGLLTGRPYQEITGDPRSGHAVAVRDEGERVVVTLTDSLARSLAAASPGRLAEVAIPWAATEEFWGQADPRELAGVLTELASLAARAAGSRERLYCWVCV